MDAFKENDGNPLRRVIAALALFVFGSCIYLGVSRLANLSGAFGSASLLVDGWAVFLWLIVILIRNLSDTSTWSNAIWGGLIFLLVTSPAGAVVLHLGGFFLCVWWACFVLPHGMLLGIGWKCWKSEEYWLGFLAIAFAISGILLYYSGVLLGR